MARSKVKSRSHHDVAHLHPLTNVPTKINFLHLTVAEIEPRQDFQAQGHCGKVKGQIKVTPRRCTLTPPNKCPYRISTSYTLWFLRYSPDKLFTTSPINSCGPVITGLAGECYGRAPVTVFYTEEATVLNRSVLTLLSAQGSKTFPDFLKSFLA